MNRSWLKTWMLIAAFTLCQIAPLLRADDYAQAYFRTIPGSDQVGNGIVTTITQDVRGLLWFGTTEGLYSYDGYRLRGYRSDPADSHSIAGNYVRSLLPHSDGSLWVGTEPRGLSVYDPVSDQFSSYPTHPDSVAQQALTPMAMVEAANGDVFMGCSGGMAHWRKDRRPQRWFLPAKGVQGQLQNETVRALLMDRRGDLWIGTGDGLQRLRGGSQSIDAIDGFAGQYVYSLFEAEDGRLWVGTQSQGVAILDPNTSELLRLPVGVGGLSHPWISGFVQPSADRIWIVTFGGGVDVVSAADGRALQRLRSDLSVPGSLALDRLTTPFSDRSGLLWLGTWGAGLQVHNPSNRAAFRTVRQSSIGSVGLSHNSVLSTLSISRDQVWIGTGGAGIDVLDLQQGVIRTHRPDPERVGALRDGAVRAMVLDAAGTPWVATEQGGLQHYLLSKDVFSNRVAGQLDRPIRRLLARRDGSIAASMTGGLAIVDRNSETATVIHDFRDSIWTLAEDADRRLWIGTAQGLFLWPPDSAAPQPVQTPRNQITTHVEITPKGGLWLADSRGLARLAEWQEGKPLFADFTTVLPQGPQGPQDFVGQMLMDRDGRLWSPRAMIDTTSSRVVELGAGEGIDIGSVAIGSASRGPDGQIYFGGTRGLLIIDPAQYQPWRYSSPIVVTSVRIDDETFRSDVVRTGIQLVPGQRRISVEFAALDYSAPNSTRYAYRLRGLDDSWIESDASHRTASFNDLWPGQYRLELRALTRSGVWTEPPLDVAITVLPAWWQRLWFVLLVLLMVIALGWALVRRRDRNLRLRAEELRALVDERTSELRQSNDSLASAHARLVGTQQQLIQQEKMAALGTLTAGVAHEINNPTNFADGAVQQLVSQHAQLHQFLRELAGSDAPPRVLEAIAARFEALGEMTSTAREGHERIKRIVSDLRQFTRLDEAERKAVPIADPIQSTVNLVRTRFDRIRFNLDLRFNPSVECQPAKLSQVFMNLIVNACEAIGERGDLGDGEIIIATRKLEDGVEIVLADNGAGMDEATRVRIFEPFFTTKEVGAGTGLGLAIVFGIVKDHSGRIEVESRPGEGTRFVLTLPLGVHD